MIDRQKQETDLARARVDLLQTLNQMNQKVATAIRKAVRPRTLLCINPILSIAIALGAGVLTGTLTKRRDKFIPIATGSLLAVLGYAKARSALVSEELGPRTQRSES
jgi:hypothetical protein